MKIPSYYRQLYSNLYFILNFEMASRAVVNGKINNSKHKKNKITRGNHNNKKNLFSDINT